MGDLQDPKLEVLRYCCINIFSMTQPTAAPDTPGSGNGPTVSLALELVERTWTRSSWIGPEATGGQAKKLHLQKNMEKTWEYGGLTELYGIYPLVNLHMTMAI